MCCYDTRETLHVINVNILLLLNLLLTLMIRDTCSHIINYIEGRCFLARVNGHVAGTHYPIANSPVSRATGPISQNLYQ